MKRLLLIMSILIAATLGADAQTGLQINRIFGGKYISDPSVTETLMSGNQRALRNRKLTTFATFKGNAEKYAPIIQPLVLADGAHATARNVRYRDGKLQYAFFVLPQTGNGQKKLNRYLYYINNQGSKKSKSPKVMVIYFEGSISPDGARSLIRSYANK